MAIRLSRWQPTGLLRVSSKKMCFLSFWTGKLACRQFKSHLILYIYICFIKQYRSEKSALGGELFLGGNNPALYSGEFAYASINTSQTFWQFKFNGLKYLNYFKFSLVLKFLNQIEAENCKFTNFSFLYCFKIFRFQIKLFL